MSRYEYTAVPAPQRGDKLRGARSAGDRFAQTLGAVLNDMAAQGWEYVRAETLPSEERSGLTGRTTVWHNLLIFRRAAERPAQASHPAVAAAAEPVAPIPAPAPVPPAPPPVAQTPAPETATPAPADPRA